MSQISCNNIFILVTISCVCDSIRGYTWWPALAPDVRICDPTTQSHSRAEPKGPVCSPYLSLLHFRLVSALLPDLSPLYCTSPYFTFFTSVHLLISHLSPVHLIFPSVHLCYPDFLWTLMFHPYLLCSTRVVFKISSLYSVSSESTLLFSASFCSFLLNLPFSLHL